MKPALRSGPSKFDQIEYQRKAYDQHYPRMREAVEQQMAHPLLGSFYDRLASLILGLGLGLVSGPGPDRQDEAAGGAGARPPVRLFEAGCGEGLVGSAVQRLAAAKGLAFAYTGADLSAAAIDLARTWLTGDLLVGDATQLVADLEPASQDIVWAKNLIHHLENPADFVRDALRAVGPNGRVVIVEPRMWCPMHWINVLWFPVQERYQYLGYRRTRAAFRRAGATVLGVEAFAWLPYELTLAIRYNGFRKLLGSGKPGVVERISGVDDWLTDRLPNLALYAVTVLEPGPAHAP